MSRGIVLVIAANTLGAAIVAGLRVYDWLDWHTRSGVRR